MLGLALATVRPQCRSHRAISRRRCEARPDYASARSNLATALAKSGQIDEAVENLRQVLAANPEDAAAKRRLADALTVRGVLLLRGGKRPEAVAQFDEALKLDPTNQDAKEYRGQALGH